MPTPRAVRLLSLSLCAAALLAIAPSPARLGPPAPAPTARPDQAATGEAKPGDDKKGDKDEKLTLERLFPEKSYWGPSATNTGFSHDGRFAAFLYRPYAERRHGNDLYIYDTQTGLSRRITGVSRMAEYQADAREVRDDREKKAKGAGVTLGQLAREQAERLGWPRDTPAGTWEGDATSEDAEPAVRPGACRLTLRESGKGFTGELRVGLVRLPLKEAEFKDAERKLSAEIDDEGLKIKGTLEAALSEDGAKLSGTATITDPAETLAFELSPAPEDENAEEKEHTPKGVLGAIGERLTLGDVVLDSDAEINDEKDGKPPAKRAPRYGGVQGYEWSKVGDEMLVLSGGDIYRLTIDPAEWDKPVERPKAEPAAENAEEAKPEADGAPGATDTETATDREADAERGATDDGVDQPEGETKPEDAKPEEKKTPKAERAPVVPYRGTLERLTCTRERESDVQYLPDGSGYTYLRDGALLRVVFGDHRIVQLDPQLKDGERMVGYALSPDGNRLVFLANRGDNFWGEGRQVTIVNYRDRFARAETVTRHMPDDPWPEAYSSVYLYDLHGYDKEEGTLERVFTKRITGPRDILRVPEWSPDSSRVAFAAFEQATGLIKILEAGFEHKEKAKRDEAKPGDKPDADSDEGEKNEDAKTDGEDTQPEGEKPKEEPKPDFKIENAKVVYEFYHFGGPNTPGMVQPQYLPDSRRLVFLTELSGYRQLHLLDPRYQKLSQLTEGSFEVYPFGISEDHSTLFATATKEDPDQEHAYAINAETGEMTLLTPGQGVFSRVAVSDDASHVLADYVDFGAPTELVAITPGDNGRTTELTDSHPEEAHKLTTVSPEYFTYENRHGQTIHGHMFKPKDWTPEDKRPLLVYVYGGPLGEQKMATRGSFNTSSYFFARYMTEVHGWVTATIDPRGASGYGAVFEKANFEQVGKPQTEDLVDGANWLVEHAGVDKTKMALHGWSFGGFQTQMVMYTEPDVFAVGIAGAGPTQWFNYNSWYTTGTIGPFDPGKLNLKDQTLLPLAKNLKGHLLLIHGMEDDNVLYQDTVNVYRELLKADKEVNVELFLDPTGHHGLGGDVKTLGRFRKYEDFLLRYLGEGKAHEPDAEPEPEPDAQKQAGPDAAGAEGGQED